MSDVTGIINPGHGCSDPGAVASTGQRESKTALNIATYCKAALVRSGINILMTRTNDSTSGKVAEVQKFIKAHRNVAFVLSIHLNGNIPGAKGAEVCIQVDKTGQTYDDKSEAWAKLILKHIQADTGQTIHDKGTIERKLDDGTDYYGVLRTAAQYKIPGVITESAFMSNADVADVDTFAEQKQFGEAIAHATCEWLGIKYVAA